MLLTIFVVYQALPDSVAPERNNDLIFNKLGYLPIINFGLNGSWLLVWQFYNLATFIIGLFIIVGMLVTAVQVMNLAT